MKTAKDVHRAKMLLEALDGIVAVRAGLKEKAHDDGCAMCLQIEAYENQGESGGVGHGEALIPLNYAPAILDRLNTEIRSELTSLGIRIPKTGRS